jgi:hypothetical protein
MDQDKAIAQALDPEMLTRLPGARVAAVRWHHSVDYHGIPSPRVWVILDETLTDAEIGYRIVEPVVRAIRDRRRAAGVDLYPCLRCAKQSELDESSLDEVPLR